MISLTFDDALHEHLDHVIPLLNQHRIPGTFYIHLTAETIKTRRADWQQAASTGHELGNHTIFHPATERKSWVTPGNALESYGLDRMKLELETANNMLESLDGETVRTFAFPCSNSILGRHGWPVRVLHSLGLEQTRWPGIVERSGLDFGSTKHSYEPILKNHFLAARGGGLLLEETPPPLDKFPRYRLLSAAIDGHGLAAIRSFVERAVAQQTWAILQFHGVNGGHHMDCQLQVFKDLIDWLADTHWEHIKTVRNYSQQLWPASVSPVTSKESVKA